MKKYFLLILILFFLLVESIKCGHNENISLGKSIGISSKILNEERFVQIYLPEDYAKSSCRYPVFITLDGERFFISTASTVQFLSKNGHMPPMIVVGVPNTNRERDFSFKKTNMNLKTGADYFLQFLAKELIPFVDKNYRTTSYRIIKGWCATGVFCIYTLFTHPHLFDAYFTSSPYLVEEASFIFELVDKYRPEKIKHKNFLYVSVGGRDRPDAKIAVPKFIELLEKKNFNNLNWHYQYFQTEDHYTIDYKTLFEALEKLYTDIIHVKKIVKEGFSAGKKRLQQLAQKFGFQEILPEQTLARMGYVLLNQELFKEALVLFKITAEFYPDSYLSYENLGEAYMYFKNKNLAILNLEKSLKIKPDNNYSKNLLKKLKAKIK